MVKNKEDLLKLISLYQKEYDFTAVVPISALKQDNLEILLQEIEKNLKEGPAYYDIDEYTDQTTRQLVEEIIREKALKLLGDEIPYGVGIVINKFQYRENGIVDIDADIVCEKQAHKSIIIGKNGAMIKEISSQARKDMEELLQTKVFLTIFVKVKEDWRNNPSVLSNLGYSNNL